ncbi:MAG: pseudouridine synthase [Candidatus Nomurabacteria bacterium]|nr:pseudouridine synthase [Candidatus Nomurabacteria bacterium]
MQKRSSQIQHRTKKPAQKLNKTFIKPVFKKAVKLESTLAPGLERLERAIAHDGVASRREAKALISQGSVKVNGKVIKEPGFGIKVGVDVIDIKGGTLREGKESVLVYKPRGIETSKTTDKAEDLHDQFPKFKHLSPIGRLDKESEGLIIMSNDGTLARALTQENSTVSKTYVVTVRENVTDQTIAKMTNGIMLDKVKTKPAIVQRLSRTSFSIVLHEGRKHQIRRMADACHLTVEDLVRTDIGFLNVGSMKAGSARKLGEADVSKLKEA